MATKNRGELAKLYALAIIIARGSVTLTDASLNPVGVLLLTNLVQSGSGRSTACETSWITDREADAVEIRSENEVWQISRSQLVRRAQELFALVVDPTPGGIGDDHPAVGGLLQMLGLVSLPRGGLDGDFNLLTDLGLFRVEVQLHGGSDSTLVNPAAGGSAFRYEILHYGSPPTESEIVALRGDDGSTLSAKVRGLCEKGYRLRFRETVRRTLADNLNAMVPGGDEIIAAMLLERFQGGTLSTPLAQLAARLSREEKAAGYPCIRRLGLTEQERREKLSAALQAIIRGFARGATVSKPWQPDRTELPGKPMRLIVTQEGELLATDPRDPAVDETYLMNVCYFDNPSAKRYDYGYVYALENRAFLDLQFQLRMSSH